MPGAAASCEGRAPPTTHATVRFGESYAVRLEGSSWLIKGQSVVRTGTLAYTFANRDGVWKIEAQAWGRTS